MGIIAGIEWYALLGEWFRLSTMTALYTMHTGGSAELAAGIVLFLSIAITLVWLWLVFR